MGSFSQTLFFGGVTQKPEIRVCSQATSLADRSSIFKTYCFALQSKYISVELGIERHIDEE